MTDTGDHITGSLARKGGRYHAVVYYYRDGIRRSKTYATGIPVGDPSRKREYTQNEHAARMALTKILCNFTLPTPDTAPRPADQLFADAVRDWLTRQAALVAPSTLAGYTYSANDVIEYFNHHPYTIREVTERTVENYIAWERTRRQPDYMPAPGEAVKRRKTPNGAGIDNTIMRRVAVIRSVLQDAKRDGIITRNPAAKSDSRVRLPKVQASAYTTLNLDEAQALLTACRDEPLWLQAAITLGLLYGLRRSEVIGIRECDLDPAQRRLTIRNTVTQQTVNGQNRITARPCTKAKNVKSFVLPADVYAILADLIVKNREHEAIYSRSYRHDWDGYLFRDVDGALISPNRLTQKFDEFLSRKGIKRLRYHDLRHSCASILYAAGVNIKTIQRILGHTHLSTTTEIYTHLYGREADHALTHMADLLLGAPQGTDGKTDGTSLQT